MVRGLREIVKVDEIYLKTGAVLVLGYFADVVAATYPGASLLGVKQEGTHLEFSAEHRFLLCLISRN